MKHRSAEYHREEGGPIPSAATSPTSRDRGASNELSDANLARAMRHRFQLIASVMIALAALLAGWSTYQAHQWIGLSVAQFSEANLQLAGAVESHIRSDRQILVDLMDFQDWLSAYQRGDLQGASQVEARFSDEFRGLFNTWRKLPATARPEHPIAHGLNSELTDRIATSQADDPTELLVTQAKARVASADEAAHRGNDFLIASALFGFALLMGIVSIRMKSTGLQITVLLGSELLTVAGVAMILFLPPQFGG